MKPLTISYICAIILTFLLLPLVLLTITGKIALFTAHGFGVDAEERVYLGTSNGKILVWKDQQQVGTLNAPTSRGYQITVEDDEILCATGSTNYRMDLGGNILEKSDDPTSRLYTSLQFRRSCTTGDGITYQLQRFWGRTRIVRDSTEDLRIIYQMLFGLFAVKVFLYIAALGWIISLMSIWYFAIQKMKVQRSASGGTP